MPNQPSCYGQSWDPNAIECKGGLDPAYKNPTDQTHRRDRCAWFGPCSQVKGVQHAPTASQSSLIPTRNLLQRPAVNIPAPRPILQAPSPPAFTPPRPPVQHTPPPMQTAHTHMPPYAQPYVPQYATVPPPHPVVHQAAAHQGMAPPHVAQYGPPLVYQPFQLPGSQMPQYLTVPEPVTDEHWFSRLMRELMRSAGKALGHTIAAFFDSNPIKRHKPQ